MSTHKIYNTPLFKKIGIQANQSLLILDAPLSIVQQLRDENLKFESQAHPDLKYDMIWLFINHIEQLECKLIDLKNQLDQNGMLWVSWYKKSSRLPTELNEDIIRATALAMDLVDIKVASVDQAWSALKLVIPRSKRRPTGPA